MQVGDGTTSNQETPVDVSGLSIGVISVALGTVFMIFFVFRNELHMQGPGTTINVVLLRCLTLCLWEGARQCMLVLLVCDLGPHRIILARF